MGEARCAAAADINGRRRASRLASLLDEGASLGGHVLGGEPELLEQFLERGRGAEFAPGHDVAVDADVATPAEAGSGLDRDAGAAFVGQHRLAVLGRLAL